MDDMFVKYKSGCIEPACYSNTLRGNRKLFKLPINTKCIWMRCNEESRKTEYKIVEIVDDLKGDFLVGDRALVKCDDDNFYRASYGWLFKIYTY